MERNRKNTMNERQGKLRFRTLILPLLVLTLLLGTAVSISADLSIGSKTVVDGGLTSSASNTLYSGLDGAVVLSGYSTEKAVFVGSGLKFTDNTAANGGAVYASDAQASFNGGTTFTDNSATGYGGAVYTEGGTTLTFSDNAVFSGNRATARGGAVYNGDGTSLTFNGATTFTANGATGSVNNGHAGAVNNYGTLTFNGAATFTGNSAVGHGGAVYNSGSYAVLSFNGDTSFAGNYCGSNKQGGAVMNCSGGSLNLSGVTFTGNSAGNGGAVYNFLMGTVNASNVTFTGNSAGNGGAVNNNNGTLNASDVTFTGNSAGGSGGAVNNTKGTVNASNVTFTGNSASSYGGAVRNENNGTVNASNVTFTGNSASSYGGAVYNRAIFNLTGNVTLTSSTDTLYNDTSIAKINWVLSGGPEGYGCITNYQNVVNNGGKLYITVAEDQPCADYVIAGGDLSDVDGKDRFTLAVDEQTTASITIGGSVFYCGKVYQLTVNNNDTPDNTTDDLLVLAVSEPDYLTFTADSAFKVKLAKTKTPSEPKLQYSTDGKSWSDLTLDNGGLAAENADNKYVIYLRNKEGSPNTGISSDRNNYYSFAFTDKDGGAAPAIAASGNIMTLLDYTKPGADMTSANQWAFFYLFKDCTTLTSAPELPATSLADYCYRNMFSGCTALTTAPKLPATTLASGCYYGMFSDCTNLKEAPELPATTLAENCYNGMFSGCTNLKEAPELPVKNLAQLCYCAMFKGCTALTKAPELPATTLEGANACYGSMFSGCIALTTAPTLPAKTLERNCYNKMFSGCIALTAAPELKATTLAEYCYEGMFSGCTALTTAPELPATELKEHCYYEMFSGCSKLVVKAGTDTSVANKIFTCPSTSDATDPVKDMFANTGGAFTGTPETGTTYSYVTDCAFVDKNKNGEFDEGTDTKYSTVQAAINAAVDGVTEAANAKTVKLLADTKEDISIASGKFVILDLNDHVLSGGSIVNSGTLKITDSSTTHSDHFWVPDASGLWVMQSVQPTTGTLNQDYFKTSGSCITGMTGYYYAPFEALCSGLFNNGTLTITNVDLIGNTSDMAGAVYNYDSRSLTMESCDIMGNTAKYVAGGIANRGTATLTGCKVAYNMSDEVGGIWSKANLILDGVTVTDNLTVDTDSDPGDNNYPSAGVYCYKGTVTLKNTVVVKGNLSSGDNANFVVAGDVLLDIANLGAASEIGISKLTSQDAVTTGKFTTNGTAADVSKFTPDSLAYRVKLNNNGTDTNTTDDYLELATFDTAALTAKTISLTLTKSDMSETQAKAIAQSIGFPTKSTEHLVYNVSGTTYTYLYGGSSSGSMTASLDTLKGYLGTCTIKVIGSITEESPVSYTLSEAVNTTYDGTAKSVSVEVTDPASGATVSYSTNGGSTWTTGDTYSVTDAGEYSVKFKIEATGYTTTTTDARSITIGKIELTVDGTSVADKVYDGTTDATVTKGTLTGVLQGESVTLSATGSFEDKAVGKEKDVSVAYTISGDDAGNYALAQESETLDADITPRDISLQSATISKEYDGTALTAYGQTGGTTVTDLTSAQTGKGYVSGEAFDYSFTGSQLFVGQSDNAFDVSNDSAQTTDYNVTKTYGKLIVNKRTAPLTITVDDQERLYDGTAGIGTSGSYYSVNGDLATGDTLTVNLYNKDSVSAAGSYTDGIIATYAITHDNGNGTYTDVTDMYANVTVSAGDLIINKRTVTITSDSATKNYDGTPLTKNATSITAGDGFVGQEGYTATVTGSQTVGGRSENTFTYQMSAGTSADNYTITTVFGTLTINPQITLNTLGGVEMAPFVTPYNSLVTKPSDAVCSGCKFVGWFADPECTDAWNFGADKVTENTTLYAGWVEDSVDVTASISGTVTGTAGAVVELWQGSEKLAATTTDASGSFTFTNIADGVYNIVVTKGSVTATRLYTVPGTALTMTLPVSSTKVEANDTGAVVGGLENITAATGETVKLSISSESFSSENDAQYAIAKTASGKTLEFYDIALQKSAANIGNSNSKVLTIIVPYDVRRNGIMVYRYHGSEAEAFTRETEPMTTPADGHFYVDYEDGLIYIYAAKFSTYAIGFTPATISGSTTEKTYTVTVPGTRNGIVTTSPANAEAGSTVTLTATPNKGYSLDTVTVTDASGAEIALTTVKDGETYTFTMPKGAVSVKAVFKADKEDKAVSNPFVDVKDSDYFYDAVLWAADQGITGGVDASHFNPTGLTTRAQMVTFLWRAAGSPEPASTACKFTDVKANAYYYKAVLWAVEQGITAGVSDTKFDPDATVTRAQAVTFLWRYEGKPSAAAADFADVKASAYYATAVAWAKTNGITGGTSATTFSPDAGCTRAQIVTFLYRDFVK